MNDREACPYCTRDTDTVWAVRVTDGESRIYARMCPGDVADLRRSGRQVEIGKAFAEAA